MLYKILQMLTALSKFRFPTIRISLQIGNGSKCPFKHRQEDWALRERTPEALTDERKRGQSHPDDAQQDARDR